MLVNLRLTQAILETPKEQSAAYVARLNFKNLQKQAIIQRTLFNHAYYPVVF